MSSSVDPRRGLRRRGSGGRDYVCAGFAGVAGNLTREWCVLEVIGAPKFAHHCTYSDQSFPLPHPPSRPRCLNQCPLRSKTLERLQTTSWVGTTLSLEPISRSRQRHPTTWSSKCVSNNPTLPDHPSLSFSAPPPTLPSGPPLPTVPRLSVSCVWASSGLDHPRPTWLT